MATILMVRRRVARVTELLGSSPAMRDLAQQIERLASSDRTPALLLGESGTGKGRVAQLLHASSPRAARPFVEVGCASLRPAELQIDDGGSLFLDEISSLDVQGQEWLLRLIDDPAMDVRVIAATARDLVGEVRAGRFREDLYYRLSVLPVHLPPLRARAHDDILDLVTAEVDYLHRQLPDAPTELSEGVVDLLLRHSWPGNVRELRNVLEHAMIVARGTRHIGVEHLPDALRGGGAVSRRHTPRSLAEVERAHIERTLRAHNANRTRSARELGISRATLINKIKAYHLDDPPNGSHRQAPNDAATSRPMNGESGDRE